MQAPQPPPDGTKTICEDRCRLVQQDEAFDASGSPKLVPSLLLPAAPPPELLPQRPAVYPPDAAGEGAEDGAGRPSLTERLWSQLGALAAPLAPLARPLGAVWSTFLSGCRPRPAAPPLEWHPRRPWLAAADGEGRVAVVEVPGAAGPGAGAPGGGRNGSLGPGPAPRPEVLQAGPGAVRALLAHPTLQPQALSLAWCPTSPGLLAVGVPGGVALWAVAGEGRPPLAAAGRGGGPWLRMLRSRVPGARVVGLSWSPDGRLLAAASPDQAGLQVHDVASGVSTPVAAGPAAFDLVRWSPCGNYVFAAGTGARHFYIFETQRWRWARWETAAGPAGPAGAEINLGPAGPASSSAGSTHSSVVAAAWAPAAPGRNPVLLACLGPRGPGGGLVALHLVEGAPGLGAQLLPVALPELGAAVRPAPGAASPPGPPRVVDLAWEAAGERLAVLLQPQQGAPLVALYATCVDPLVSARLLGFARPGAELCAGAGAGAAGQAAASAAPAALLALPGCLTAARTAPTGAGAGGPCCVVSARVGARGVYNLPCYF
ncbi:hypothetical protein HYH03_018482 [Edaphochlamys debaryana]|uniref:Aladin n=1 Tax=Edaphochlamys debaryana TaxID=47281 RepID=A0A835XEJ0_9CHLO|nr:hypothetical protein HYH03_018482 [Edaphochlamys debaryana]|eukprot:KAG2482598.1 hypothetical protein HYH03_018482 [Edaphochlamys debaryana]